MSLLEKFTVRSKNKVAKIGIGLSEEEFHTNKILYATIKFINKFKSNKLLKVVMFGNEDIINLVKNNSSYSKYKDQIELVGSSEPEIDSFEYLNNYKINSIVRGSFSSTKFLKLVKQNFYINEINRLAVLETHGGYQTFYGPVGIDECNNTRTKIKFIEMALKQLKAINVTPIISVLSGGREGDKGRDEYVDKLIREAEEVVDHFGKIKPKLKISHDQILIENAIKNKVNLIIAPDGISGNLIYRTLVHLGGGKAYGAIYMGIDRTIIDTSRVGNLSEINGALLLALALTN